MYGTRDGRRAAARRRRDELRASSAARMGSAVGEAITRAAELALEQADAAPGRLRLGRRAHAGGLRLADADGEDEPAFARLHEEGVLVVCLLTDPTYGGVSASFATLGDVLLAEPRAYIGFAGPKVIEQTIRQKLPRGLPDRRVPARPRDARPGRAAREHPGRAAQAARAAHAARSGGLPDEPRAPSRLPIPTRCRSAPPGTSSSSRATSSGRTRSSTSATSSTTSRSCTATGSSTRTRPSSAASATARRPRRRRHRPPEGPHDERDDGAELRHAEPRGLPQGRCA